MLKGCPGLPESRRIRLAGERAPELPAFLGDAATLFLGEPEARDAFEGEFTADLPGELRR
jgi:hypothetical protein